MKVIELFEILPENALIQIVLENDNDEPPLILDPMPITSYCDPIVLNWLVRQMYYENPGMGCARYVIQAYVAERLPDTKGTVQPTGYSRT